MDMIKMMKKASDLQKNMKKKQQELSRVKVQNSFDGVSVEINCDMTISSVKISQELVNNADLGKIEKAVHTATQGALDLAKKSISKEMGSLTAGMNLPF